MIIIKKGFFIIAVVAGVTALSGCETLDFLRPQQAETEVVPATSESSAQSQDPALESATVIESFYNEPSNWRPILPHELDAHFEESDTLMKLMRYSRKLSGLTPRELEEEYQSLGAQSNDQQAAVNTQMQQALLLSTPAAPYRNDQQAKKILAGIINSGEKRGLLLKEYAYSVLVHIEQREKAEQQNEQLRKSLKKEIERREELEQKREQLEQKLEALKSIEESITKRQSKTEEPVQ